jgi:tRNA modification GTPase
MAFCQASFEFIEEENMTFGNEIRTIIQNIIDTIAQLKITFDQQQRIRQGIRIAIIGSVNAGKSSLFNALLQQNRSIVTNIAGTTRDVIEAGLYKNQNYWTLIDTAGLRQTDDIIEKEGIERSLHEAELADIILLVIDASRTMHTDERDVYNKITEQYHHKIMVIYNKCDLEQKTEFTHKGFSVSTHNRSDNKIIEEAIENKIATLLDTISSPFLLNSRHYNLLITLEKQCHEILPLLTHNIAYELLSIHLQEAAAHVSELTGKTISENAMDEVFRSFCVGK